MDNSDLRILLSIVRILSIHSNAISAEIILSMLLLLQFQCCMKKNIEKKRMTQIKCKIYVMKKYMVHCTLCV